MRDSGVRGVLVYCQDYPVQPFGRDQRGGRTTFACPISSTACGRRGGDVRPDFHLEQAARRGDRLSLVPWFREPVPDSGSKRLEGSFTYVGFITH
jgi:hypothetical protein